jgi:DNA repair protein RecO
MSYTKYKTRGIVIGGSNIGEASRNYNIFTQDFGLIRVRAQGIRELGSKLKYHLQNLYLIQLALIKGKSGWRVTEAKKVKSFPDIFRLEKSKILSSTKILLFLKQMLLEEDKDSELFDIITGGLNFMEFGILEDARVRDLESLIILRVLRKLGYIKSKKEFEALLLGVNYNNDLLDRVRENRLLIIKEINRSIEASGL